MSTLSLCAVTPFPTPVVTLSPTPTPVLATAWESFWPDLTAGLISGLFTGLVVGAIFAWSQSRAARKKERREIELRWEALRPRVGAQLLDPWDRRVMGNSLEEFAKRPDALLELIEDVPLGSWAEVLDSEELRHLHEFSKAATELRGAATKFDGFLLHSIAGHLVEDRLTADVAQWHQAGEDARLVQPFAIRALFAHPSFPWGTPMRDIRENSPILKKLVEHPPVTYREVLAMVERAERHYAECTVIVDAVMTRYWYH